MRYRLAAIVLGVVVLVALGVGLAIEAAPWAGDEARSPADAPANGYDRSRDPCVVENGPSGCLDISSSLELCSTGYDEHGRPTCTMGLEGEEPTWSAAERAQFLDWMAEESRRQRLEEEAGRPFPNLTGCAAIGNPDNPTLGCTPPVPGHPDGKPPTPHAIPYEPGRQREYDEIRRRLLERARNAGVPACIERGACIDLRDTEFESTFPLEGDELKMTPEERARFREELLAELRALPICPADLALRDPNDPETIAIRGSCRPDPGGQEPSLSSRYG